MLGEHFDLLRYYIDNYTSFHKRGYGKFLRMWAYSRIDTIRRPGILKLVRSAGIKWLCLGIESADKKIRTEISKGKFEDVDITTFREMIDGWVLEFAELYSANST